MSTEKVLTGCMTWIVLHLANGAMALIGGWLLMLAVGVVHAEWITDLPTVGYWWAVVIVWLLQGTFMTIKREDIKS
jgi:hypothetical protein